MFKLRHKASSQNERGTDILPRRERNFISPLKDKSSLHKNLLKNAQMTSCSTIVRENKSSSLG